MELIGHKNKRKVKFTILIFLAIAISFVLVEEVSANFVCGLVHDASQSSASWMQVRLYYSDHPREYSNCEISPANNKFCCSTSSIPGKTWSIGERVSSEIVDFTNGYVAGPVSVLTTGEGYDILEEMNLEKVIVINNPNNKFLISDKKEINLSAKILSEYSFVELEEGSSKNVICENCTEIFEEIELEEGMNYYNLIASSKEREFQEEIIVARVSGVSVEKINNCEKCKTFSVPKNTLVDIDINIKLSSEIEGLTLKEIIPKGWEVVDVNSGTTKQQGLGEFKIISWENITGSIINKTYTLKSPSKISLFKENLFETFIEDTKIDSREIKVRGGLFPSGFAFGGGGSRRIEQILTNQNVTFLNSNPLRPVIINIEDDFLDRVIVYPSSSISDQTVGVLLIEPDKKVKEGISYYLFESELSDEKIDRIFVEFKVSKEFLLEESYRSIKVLNLIEDWSEEGVKLSKVKEDENFTYYQVILSDSKGLALVGDEKYNKLVEDIKNNDFITGRVTGFGDKGVLNYLAVGIMIFIVSIIGFLAIRKIRN